MNPIKALLRGAKIKVKKTTMPTDVIQWVQCASSKDYCPIFPNDPRIVEVKV